MSSLEFDTRVDMPLFREFFAAHEKQLQKRRPRAYKIRELLPLMLAYVGIVSAFIFYQEYMNWPAILVTTAFLLVVFFDSLLRSVRIADRIRLAEDGLALGRHHYVFSDAGIDASGAGHSMHIDWQLVTGVLETKNALVVQLDQLFAFVLRKEDIADLSALRQYIEQRIPSTRPS